MYKILNKEYLSPDVIRMEIDEPEIAAKRKPGQFLILRAHERGERIPLTIADADPEKGFISIIFQVVGKATRDFAALEINDSFLDVVGPLGNPTHISAFGHALCVCGGIGTAPLYPIAKALNEAGNRVTTILGARTEELLILRKEMEAVSEKLFVATDDGSVGHKGFVTELVKEVVENEPVDMVFTIGPVVMMKAVCAITRPINMPTTVSLNAIMVDGTGMCGGCRVTVDDETRFTCVDGPEFDGLKVDFDELQKRLSSYKKEEVATHQCKLD